MRKNNEKTAISDPATAFLTELQELMRKYDAEIGYRSIGDIWSCYLITVGGKKLKYEMESITPDDVFDFE